MPGKVDMNIEVDSVVEPGRMIPTSSARALIRRKNSKSRQRDTSSVQIVTPSSSTSELNGRAKSNDTSGEDDISCFDDEDKYSKLDKGASSTMEADDGSPCNKKFDYEAFNDRRVMSPLQERWNAITMLPAMFYGIYFVLAGCWLTSHMEIARGNENSNSQYFSYVSADGSWVVWAWARNLFWNTEEFETEAGTGCISISWLPNFHALPPLPLLSGALGIVAHAPFSFMYHWSYATKLPPSKRLEHWSRRLDHAFIHFASACMAYATSGRTDYLIFNVAYNLDCAYRQFEVKVRPRRNQIRTTISILLYILPVLCRGHFVDFAKLVLIFTSSGWFFITYPIGGWSHAMFHIIIAFLPHVIMNSACKLQISQQQIELAAQCAIRAGR